MTDVRFSFDRQYFHQETLLRAILKILQKVENGMFTMRPVKFPSLFLLNDGGFKRCVRLFQKKKTFCLSLILLLYSYWNMRVMYLA